MRHRAESTHASRCQAHEGGPWRTASRRRDCIRAGAAGRSTTGVSTQPNGKPLSHWPSRSPPSRRPPDIRGCQGSPVSRPTSARRLIGPRRQAEPRDGAEDERHRQQHRHILNADQSLANGKHEHRQSCQCGEAESRQADHCLAEKNLRRTQGADEKKFEGLTLGQLRQTPTDEECAPGRSRRSIRLDQIKWVRAPFDATTSRRS